MANGRRALLLAAALCGAWMAGEARAEDANREGCPGRAGGSNWLGLGKTLAERGISLSLAATQVYQANLRGGLATHRRSGRYSGSVDLEVDLDMEKLAGLGGGRVYGLAEGSWSDGLNDSSLDSLLGVNADAGGDRWTDVSQLWYEQKLLDNRMIVRAGKLDLTGGFEHHGCPVSFDCSAYANDENTQFLSDSLVNNPTIPFPDQGLGAVVYVEPVENFYVSGGIADAQADRRETGFRTALHGEDCFFAITEMGFVTDWGKGLTGAYRAGLWYDPQPRERFSGSSQRDSHGVYATFDQLLLKENADANDEQGLGAFLRFGCADGDVSEIQTFWSVGGQYKGLIPGRDADVLGLGVAQGILSRDSAPGRTSQETVVETYYNAKICEWMHVSGHVQYLANPGGTSGAGDALVVGVRLHMHF